MINLWIILIYKIKLNLQKISSFNNEGIFNYKIWWCIGLSFCCRLFTFTQLQFTSAKYSAMEPGIPSMTFTMVRPHKISMGTWPPLGSDNIIFWEVISLHNTLQLVKFTISLSTQDKLSSLLWLILRDALNQLMLMPLEPFHFLKEPQ